MVNDERLDHAFGEVVAHGHPAVRKESVQLIAKLAHTYMVPPGSDSGEVSN